MTFGMRNGIGCFDYMLTCYDSRRGQATENVYGVII